MCMYKDNDTIQGYVTALVHRLIDKSKQLMGVAARSCEATFYS